MKSNCYHKEGHDAPCDEYGDTKFMLLYGAVQMLLAQIPDLQETEFLSIIAAVMSFAYASIGLGLGMAKTIGTYPLFNLMSSYNMFFIMSTEVRILL